MYKEKTTKGFGDIAITNKGKSEFLIKVKDLIEWEKLNKILQSKLKRKNNKGIWRYSNNEIREK